MIRRIIRIDEEACTGCGACARACHEGAIEMIDGKAKLTREDYCDGLGDCLPACPANAISFEEREAPAYDEQAVLKAKAEKDAASAGCPGTKLKEIRQAVQEVQSLRSVSCLRQWPCQLKLVPVNAPYFDEADLLIAADCCAYACGSFHRDFMSGRITLIGCPKLDGDYTERLAAIFAENQIRSIQIARMEVPCCGGLENAVKRAMEACKKEIPCSVVSISTDGRILN